MQRNGATSGEYRGFGESQNGVDMNFTREFVENDEGEMCKNDHHWILTTPSNPASVVLPPFYLSSASKFTHVGLLLA
jgi:hypothetical protein